MIIEIENDIINLFINLHILKFYCFNNTFIRKSNYPMRLWDVIKKTMRILLFQYMVKHFIVPVYGKTFYCSSTW